MIYLHHSAADLRGKETRGGIERGRVRKVCSMYEDEWMDGVSLKRPDECSIRNNFESIILLLLLL